MGGMCHIVPPQTCKPSHFRLDTALKANVDLLHALLLPTIISHTQLKFD